MKKELYLSMLAALVLLLPAGCAQQEGAVPPDTSGDPWGFALSASKVSQTGCLLSYAQSGGDEITGTLEYGAEYHLEQETVGVWTKIPALRKAVWMLVAYEVSMDSSWSEYVDWSDLYGRLPPGHYRLVKNIHDFRGTGDYDRRDYYAEFDIE